MPRPIRRCAASTAALLVFAACCSLGVTADACAAPSRHPGGNPVGFSSDALEFGGGAPAASGLQDDLDLLLAPQAPLTGEPPAGGGAGTAATAPSGRPPVHIPRGGPDTSQYARPSWIAINDARYEIQTRTPMQGRPGSVKIQRWGYGVNVLIGPESDFQISIPFDYEESYYRFRGTELSPGVGAPLRDVHQWYVAPNFEARLDDEWVLIGGGVLANGAQWGADFNDSTRYGGFAGAKYLFSDTFNITFGLSAFTRLEADPSVFPVLGFEWAFADRWRLYTEGNELSLEHDPTDWLTLKAVLGYEDREFRLDENAPTPSGVFTDRRVPLTFAVDIIPHPALTISAYAGLTIYQQLQIDTQAGERVSHQQVKPAPVFGVSLEFTF